MNTQDHYYISTGEQTKMYTLRVQWMDYTVIEGDRIELPRDNYIQNLSIEKEKAVEKAKAMGYIVSEPKFTLEEIIRRESEEIARIRQERDYIEECERIAKEDSQIEMIKSGHFPFGKHRGYKFEVADVGYIKYWLKSDPQDSVTQSLVNVLTAKFPKVVELLNLKGNGDYFGDIKKRYQKLTGTIIAKFYYETFYGWNTVMKVVLDSGEMVVYNGAGALSIKTVDDDGVDQHEYVDEGDTIMFAGTIKEHNEYRGEIQSIIQRVKVKEIKEF